MHSAVCFALKTTDTWVSIDIFGTNQQAMRVITKKEKFKPHKLTEQEASFAKRKTMLTMYEKDLDNPVLV